jgi:hypothetical protein
MRRACARSAGNREAGEIGCMASFQKVVTGWLVFKFEPILRAALCRRNYENHQIE